MRLAGRPPGWLKVEDFRPDHNRPGERGLLQDPLQNPGRRLPNRRDPCRWDILASLGLRLKRSGAIAGVGRTNPRIILFWSNLMPTKTPEKKPAPKSKSGSKPNALQQPLKPSAELAAVVGKGPLPRSEAVSKVWAYIKSNKLQNPSDGREILADDNLRKVFGKDKVTMFEMNKHLAAHLK
jgi:upstream activation factor subunit UAF30